MFEVMATLAVLMIGGAFLALIAVTGLLFASLIKLIFFPVAIAFDLIKWVVMIVVVPLTLFVLVPIALLVIVPVLLAILLPIVLGLFVVGVPLLLLGLVGAGAAHVV